MASRDRRSFLGVGLGALIAGAISPPLSPPKLRQRTGPIMPGKFPRQNPELVEEMVRVAHFDLGRVTQLVSGHPALAKAAIDWGFGDWEDALGAASHMGRYDIAQLLIANGARPTLFSAAMMGQLDVVKAFISSAPGCQSIPGPHSITLLEHARAGGDRAHPVREYLEQIGGADPQPAGKLAISDAERNRYVGTYAFGDAPDEVLVVTNEKAVLSITRPGLPFARGLTAVGPDEFVPLGAEAVRVRFSFRDDGIVELRVFDPDLLVTASRKRLP
jgi:hypothetical protein